jgi:hypothetical protein
MPGDEPRFAHEPGSALVGAFEEERDVVEQVERDGSRGAFFRQALEHEDSTLFGGKNREGLKRVGRRLFQQNERIGLERGAGHFAKAEGWKLKD